MVIIKLMAKITLINSTRLSCHLMSVFLRPLAGIVESFKLFYSLGQWQIHRRGHSAMVPTLGRSEGTLVSPGAQMS